MALSVLFAYRCDLCGDHPHCHAASREEAREIAGQRWWYAEELGADPASDFALCRRCVDRIGLSEARRLALASEASRRAAQLLGG